MVQQSRKLRSVFFSYLILMICLFAGAAESAFGKMQTKYAGEYRIRIAESQPLVAVVEAQIEVANGRLLMATGGGIDHLPNQWATFVERLEARDGQGKQLTLEARGSSGWQITGGYAGKAILRYQVNLSFANAPWPPGNEQAGLWRDGSLYLVTKPLFVTSETKGQSAVSLSIPAGWRVSTPWDSGETANTFLARSRDDLVDNSIVLGRHTAFEFRSGPFTLVLALVGPISQQKEVVASTLKAAAGHMARVFNKAAPARYMVTLFYADQDDGESYERSAAFTTATVPTRSNIMLWGNNLAHELYHIWIGGQIRLAEADNEWFDEGFTDYYADLALAQSGLIDPNIFLRKMEKVMARYVYFMFSSAFPRMSLVEASRNKNKYRFGVYDAGWTVAFCLDVLIQKHSGGKKSLDDLMRALYDRISSTPSPVSRSEFFSMVSQVAGADLSTFFAKYVEGKNLIPIQDYLSDIGLEGNLQSYAAELWITPKKVSSAREQAIFRKIVSSRRIKPRHARK